MPITYVVKTLQTALNKGQILPQNLQDMISKVEKEAVEAYRDWYDYRDRKKRLDDLKKKFAILGLKRRSTSERHL